MTFPLVLGTGPAGRAPTGSCRRLPPAPPVGNPAPVLRDAAETPTAGSPLGDARFGAVRASIVLFGLAILGLAACGDDDGGVLPPTYQSFSTITSRSCQFSGSCHGGSTVRRSSSNLNFQMFADDYRMAVVGVPAFESEQVYRIMPGDPEASYLWHKLNATHEGLPMCGSGDQMPRLADDGLPQNELDAIREWITMGAPGPDGTPAEVPPPLPGYPEGCPPSDAGM